MEIRVTFVVEAPSENGHYIALDFSNDKEMVHVLSTVYALIRFIFSQTLMS